MKKLLLAAVLLFASTSAHAFEDSTRMMSLPEDGVKDAQPVQNVCAARTYCPNLGTYIWCQAVGNGCTWSTLPGVYVHCEGYDASGMWRVFHVNC